MPHIAETMLRGKDQAAKQALADKLRDTLIETLGVDEKFVSVSIEDIGQKDWKYSMQHFPEETPLIHPNKKQQHEKDSIDPFHVIDNVIHSNQKNRI